jgi:hypothetical protein
MTAIFRDTHDKSTALFASIEARQHRTGIGQRRERPRTARQIQAIRIDGTLKPTARFVVLVQRIGVEPRGEKRLREITGESHGRDEVAAFLGAWNYRDR